MRVLIFRNKSQFYHPMNIIGKYYIDNERKEMIPMENRNIIH